MKNNISYNNQKQIRSMVITSILLALATISAYLTNFIKLSFLSEFLTLDISLIFIIPLIVITSVYWASFASISLGLLSFLWSGLGGWVGVIFNIVVNLLTVLVAYFIIEIIFKKNKLNLYWKWSIAMGIVTIFSCLFYSLLNGLIFTPLYWSLYFNTPLKSPSFIDAEILYNTNQIPQAYLLFIPNYWGGIFGLYISFNLIKFICISFLTVLIITFLVKANIIEKYFGNENKKRQL